MPKYNQMVSASIPDTFGNRPLSHSALATALDPDSPALHLLGLDVGSTTTSVMVASARLVRNCVTGRTELGDVTPVFRPDPVFTPFRGETLDIALLESQLDRWLADARIEPTSIASGGALVTGLAARSANAAAVKLLVKERFRQAVVAATDDPCLESWLAFMGNTLGLSRADPQRAFINLDIGGGTTNIAWGLAGEVHRCGCYYVGARHIQVEPGTYRVRAMSPFAVGLLDELGASVTIGAELKADELTAVLDFYVSLLESVVTGGQLPPAGRAAQQHCQAEFTLPGPGLNLTAGGKPVFTLSGGVGELAYHHARGEPLPGTTAFGDLGIDLARRLCDSPILGRDLMSHIPSGMGRATVHGLTAHSTEVSGATLFLPRPEILPLTDLPILGTFGPETNDEELVTLLNLAARVAEGACLRVEVPTADAPTVRGLGQRLAGFLGQGSGGMSRPLVLLTSDNIGKALGQYATRWGKLPTTLVVIDEIPGRRAHFATIGKPHQGLVPVSFHGLEAQP
jgi:ethanolamine utilization protein EutA